MLMQVLLLKLLLALMVEALALAMTITTKVVILITLVMMTTVALFPRTGWNGFRTLGVFVQVTLGEGILPKR